jgi:hypothetical protein
MAYTNPTTQATDHIVTATEWNTDLVDNIRALKNPPSASFVANEATDYTITTTTFANVDGTSGKFLLSITTTGGDVMVHFSGGVNPSSRCYFDLQVDGSGQVGGNDGITGCGSSLTAVSFTRLITGLAAGTHTFALQARVNSGSAVLYAGAGTAGFDLHPQFWVRELS